MNIARVLTVVSLTIFGGLAVSSEAGAQSVLNPGSNIAPNPNFFDSGACSGSAGSYTCANPCVSPSLSWPTDSNSPGCDSYVLEAINDARATIGENVLTLPSNWYSLSAGEQLFVLLDMERVGDGETPVLGINASLSAQAESAAQNSADPVPTLSFPAENGPGGGYWGSVWAQGISPLAADYLWMYEDGWGGSAATTSNQACTSASSSDCWGHRDILLGAGAGMRYGVGTTCVTCEMGVGYSAVGVSGSWTAIIEVAKGTLPAMSFTWANEVPYFSSPPPITTTTIATTPPVGSAVSGIRASGDGIGMNTARVRWSLASGVSPRITMVVYRGTTCVTRVHSVGVTWSGVGVSSGTLVSTGSHFYSQSYRYSAVVSVATPSGSLSSSCVQLGQP
jgi:hypothetical protein